jgi:hypothetical protein
MRAGDETPLARAAAEEGKGSDELVVDEQARVGVRRNCNGTGTHEAAGPEIVLVSLGIADRHPAGNREYHHREPEEHPARSSFHRTIIPYKFID